MELCVDALQWEALSAGAADGSGALDRLKELGAVSMGVYWNGTDDLAAKAAEWEIYRWAGFRLTLRPDPAPFTPVNLSALSTLPGGKAVSHLLFAGPAVWGAPDISETLNQMQNLPWSMPWVEFARQAGLSATARRFPGRTIRAHSVDDDEMARLSPASLVARYRRAVRERGARFLYLRFFPGLDLGRNLSYLRRLSDGLKADGFKLGEARPLYKPGGEWVRVRQWLAFLAAVLLPVLAFRWMAFPSHNVPVSVLGMTVFSLVSALVVAGLLSAPVFEFGFEQFRGVKAALVLPLLAAFFLLYPPSEIRGWLKVPLTLGNATLFLGLAALAAVYVMRSGHGTSLDAGGAELRLREGLENFFGVRPRFKEFAIGHPLLWLGVYIRSRFPERPHFYRPLLLIGFIGPISIINTFCHAHIPLSVSLLRTWHGIWLGGLIGGFLISLSKAVLPAKAAVSIVPEQRRRIGAPSQNGFRIKRSRVTNKKP